MQHRQHLHQQQNRDHHCQQRQHTISSFFNFEAITSVPGFSFIPVRCMYFLFLSTVCQLTDFQPQRPRGNFRHPQTQRHPTSCTLLILISATSVEAGIWQTSLCIRRITHPVTRTRNLNPTCYNPDEPEMQRGAFQRRRGLGFRRSGCLGLPRLRFRFRLSKLPIQCCGSTWTTRYYN